ncbi:MAG: YlbF family regulator [Clostridia bacterium]|nr:YlbF family regulator [Clostridia bacterium]
MNYKEATKILGEALAAEPAVINFNAAKAAFDADAELSSMLAEYRTARTLLGEMYANPSLSEEEGRSADALNTRVAELTEAIRQNAVYRALEEAQGEVNALMSAVNADISFYAFGERPEGCTHDCSSCGGCH